MLLRALSKCFLNTDRHVTQKCFSPSSDFSCGNFLKKQHFEKEIVVERQDTLIFLLNELEWVLVCRHCSDLCLSLWSWALQQSSPQEMLAKGLRRLVPPASTPDCVAGACLEAPRGLIFPKLLDC